MFSDEQVEVLRSLIAGHAHRLVGGKTLGHVDLRDVEQEAWVAACRKQPKWDGRQKLQTFHYLRTRGAMIDYLRKTFGTRRPGRIRRPEMVSLDGLELDFMDEAPSPLDALIAQEEGRA